MKLYGQHGYGPGDKLAGGLGHGMLDGVIIGAKDTSQDAVPGMIEALHEVKADADVLFDPHYYAHSFANVSNNRLGSLTGYDFWGNQPRNDLFYLQPANIGADIRSCLQFQNELNVTSFIAPNVVVPAALNSRAGAVATNFLSQTLDVAREVNADKEVYATLALSREAMLDFDELDRFTQLVTGLPRKPDGVYLLVAGSGGWDDLFHPEVVSNLLYFAYALKLNGFKVIAGYSDLVGSLLATVGVDGFGSGWFQTLRAFSLQRFAPPPRGGAAPRSMYLSCSLFNRILIPELLAAYGQEPDVRNNLPTDDAYFDEFDTVTEPATKVRECLQSWDALAHLHRQFSVGDTETRVQNAINHLEAARATYERLARQAIVFETKTSSSHLQRLVAGLMSFQETL